MQYIFYLHMPNRLLYDYKIVIKILDGHTSKKGKNQQWPTRTQLRQEMSRQGLFVIFGGSSAEEGYTDTNAYWKIL